MQQRALLSLATSALATAALAAGPLVPGALASDLQLRVESGGQSMLMATPGQTISFDVVGELSDANNEGLAAFRFNAFFSGGAMPAMSGPAAGDMLAFQPPLGFANPAGYGGTTWNGVLLQVGGAQNTIGNIFAPIPSGSVITDVAAPGQPEVLATGQLTLPNAPGTYSINLNTVGGTVIRAGETGSGFWRVDPLGGSSVDPLIVTVPGALSVDAASLSLSAGGTANFSLTAGAPNANRTYLLLGSLTGMAPPTELGALFLPLVADSYSNFTLLNFNTPILTNTFSTLDGAGNASASLNVPGGSSASLAGLTAYHAYVLLTPSLDYASNAVSTLLTL